MSKYDLTKNPLIVLVGAITILASFADFGTLISGALEATVSFSPNPVRTSAKTSIVYEIEIFNKLSRDISLEEVVIKNEKGLILETLNSDDLKRSFQQDVENSSNVTALKAGANGVIYLEIAVDNDQLPVFLDHVIVSKDSSGEIFTDRVRSAVSSGSALVLGQPLQTGQWAAIYNAEWTRGHRRVIFNKNGVDRIPGRFAIDFMKLDNEGHYAKGDENVIANWYGYGANVLAVADGVVSSTRDDFKESKTISDHPDYPSDMATGNYISLKIDDGHYVFYEHLKPQSILVKKGQSIKKGQVIAKLGFTGQTTGPHLHLHVADNDSPLGAQGLPFVFDKFDLAGTYPDFSAFGKARWTDSNRIVTTEHPPSNSVIRFY